MNNKQSAVAPVNRSEKFYMDTVVFKVEDTLFKVPKDYFVENSSIFRDMFTLPQADQADQEGSNDHHPLVLEHVNAEAFTALLEYIYPKQVHDVNPASPVRSDTNKSDELLQSLIELARRWMFRGLHAQLVREHYSSIFCSASHMVEIGKRHGIPHWLEIGYIALATQTKSPPWHEIKVLGWEDAVRVFHLREKFAAHRLGLGDREKERQVREVFAEELQAVEREYKEFYSNQD